MLYETTPVGPHHRAAQRGTRSRVSTPALAAFAVLAAGCAAPGDTSVLDDRKAVAGLEATDDQLSVNDLLEVMADDLRTVGDPDRASVRYITLAHLHNAGASRASMETHRAAMNLALNSLSWARLLTLPVPVDENETVYRIDLEDYGWDAATWDRIVGGYPYNVRYDSESPLLEFRDDLADEIRDDTEASVPYVHGDWFVAATMQPSLYYGTLELPATLDGLERLLRIDTADATADRRVDRAGFVRSGVSSANRMIARFALPDLAGFWTSCDVAPRGPGSTILTEPVDPDCDSREVVFTLPNGLPAYYLANQVGDRQNTAPRSLVTDPNRADRTVQAGISCAGCHSGTGVIARTDEVRDHVLTQGTDDLDEVLALYPTRDEMARLVRSDQNVFVYARRAAGAPDATVEPLTRVSVDHDMTLDLREAAASIGLDLDTFRAAIDANVSGLPPSAMVLRRADGVIRRETWNQIFGEMVCALELGAPCDTRGADDCSCR